MSTRSQLISAAGISILDKLIKFSFLIILSRLFTPTEFGIIAAASFVVGFAELFSNIGFANCLIQMKRIDDRAIRTALTLSVIMSILISFIFFFVGPLLSQWINVPELESLVPLLIVILFCRGLAGISGALLQRDMQASTMLWINIFAYLIGIVGITFPLYFFGFGYISLIYGMVGESITYVLSLYLMTRHSVSPLIDKSTFHHILNKGVGYFSTRTLTYFALNTEYLLVSRYLGTANLGIYSRAYRLIEYPCFVYRMAVDRVVFPMLSKQQDNPEYLRKTIIYGFFLTVAISAPLFGFIAANGLDIIVFMLGNQWGEAGQILSILAFFGTFRVGFLVFETYLKSQAHVKALTLHSLAFLFLVLVCCGIGVRFGLQSAAIGVGIALILNCLNYNYYVAKLTETSLTTYIKIYMTGFAFFFWFYIPNSIISSLLSGGSPLFTLIVNSAMSMLLALLLLSSPLQAVWGQAGEETRLSLRDKTSKAFNKLVSKVESYRSHNKAP